MLHRTFRFFHALDYTGMPDLSQYGIRRVHLTDREYLAGDWPNYDHSQPVEAKARAMADAAAAEGRILVIDEETWIIDPLAIGLPLTTDDVLASLGKLHQLADWIRDQQPKLRWGIYSQLPYVAPAGTDRRIIRSVRQLLRKVDCLFPSFYVHADRTEQQWLERAEQIMGWADATGKPTYPFLWPDIQTDPGPCPPVPADRWGRILRFCRRHADGIVLWGGYEFMPGKMTLKAWDERAEWWKVVKQLTRAS